MTADLKLEGFDEIRKRLDPKLFEQRLKANVSKATRLNAFMAAGFVKKDIYSGAGKFHPLSEVTKAIKGSTKTLVDTGELVKSIVGEEDSWDVAVIGVQKNRMQKSKSGKVTKMINVALTLHEGTKKGIRVTKKMRAYFRHLAKKYPGKVFPLKPRTRFIKIKGRPFMKAVLAKGRKKKYTKNWQEALRKTLAGKS